jgi:hypothetical protein
LPNSIAFPFFIRQTLLVDGNQDYDNIIVTKHLVHIHTEPIFGRSAEKISYGLKASINRLTVDHALERAK